MVNKEEKYLTVVKRISLASESSDYLAIPEIQVSELIFGEGDKVKITIEKCD